MFKVADVFLALKQALKGGKQKELFTACDVITRRTSECCRLKCGVGLVIPLWWEAEAQKSSRHTGTSLIQTVTLNLS